MADRMQSTSDLGPFDGEDLVRWAESYGHPEQWAKKAQALHGDNERLREALGGLLVFARGNPVVLERIHSALDHRPTVSPPSQTIELQGDRERKALARILRRWVDSGEAWEHGSGFTEGDREAVFGVLHELEGERSE